MKTKKVSFQDDSQKKKKQPSRIKKKHVLKQESKLKHGKFANKFKKHVKKFGKSKFLQEGEASNKTKGWKKSSKNLHMKKPAPIKSKQKTVKPQVGKSILKSTSSKNLAQDLSKKKKRPFPKSETETASEGNQEGKKTKLCEMKRKDRKKIRKQQKNTQAVFDMSVSAKKIWEVLRRDDCSDEKKRNLIAELLKLIKGHVKQLVYAHDTVRVIECIIAAGSPSQREEVFKEIREDIIPVAKSKYAKHLLMKFMNYGTKEQKDFIVNSFKGQILPLVKHAEAASVVETAYNEYANAKQRSEMIQEFYGPTFALFKDESARNLDDILLKHPDQKAAILNHMKEVLMKITEKAVIRHSIVHYVLREFMNHADSESRSEIISNIADGVVEILHTKDGSRVGMNCLWHGTVKDRKKIVKSMKMHVCKIAKEEHGSLVLIALFDCVDDSKLVQQIIVHKLCENFMEMVEDTHARRVLLYLICPRDSRYFHPDVVNILKAGDNNEHSKKDPETRRRDLSEAASPLLLKLMSENVQSLVKSNATSSFLLGILQNALGDRKEAFESVASLLLHPYHVKTSCNELHPLEEPAVHFLVKKLLQGEVDKETSDSDTLFSVVLVSSLPENVMKSWVDCNRGTFVLLSLLKSGVQSVVARVIKEMTGLNGVLKSKDYKGAELLLAEIKSHSANNSK